MIGKFVIVRTYSAGVHCGILEECHGTAVRLTNARRIWRWSKANTLHELSINGGSLDYSRISEPVDEILLLQAIEVIPCTLKAQSNLMNSRWPE
jgi:hypothetical protein